MKRNIDCVRDIMIYVEEDMGMDDFLDVERLNKGLESKGKTYDIEDIKYSIVMLKEADLARVKIIPAGGKEVYGGGVYRLTYKGHEYLDVLRNDNRYNKAKGVAKKLGVGSIDFLVDIAKELIKIGITTTIVGG